MELGTRKDCIILIANGEVRIYEKPVATYDAGTHRLHLPLKWTVTYPSEAAYILTLRTLQTTPDAAKQENFIQGLRNLKASGEIDILATCIPGEDVPPDAVHYAVALEGEDVQEAAFMNIYEGMCQSMEAFPQPSREELLADNNPYEVRLGAYFLALVKKQRPFRDEAEAKEYYYRNALEQISCSWNEAATPLYRDFYMAVYRIVAAVRPDLKAGTPEWEAAYNEVYYSPEKQEAMLQEGGKAADAVQELKAACAAMRAFFKKHRKVNLDEDFFEL